MVFIAGRWIFWRPPLNCVTFLNASLYYMFAILMIVGFGYIIKYFLCKFWSSFIIYVYAREALTR